MRAVNLIPADAAARAGGRSGGGAYVLLGVLAALVAGVAYHVLTNNAIAEHRAQLAALQTQTHAAQAAAEATRPYREFAALAQARVQTVRQLGAARFDWHRALSDLSKVVPGNVWLSSLLGTVAPGVSVEGGASGATNSLRAALPNPAIELTGCTIDHDSVVRLISRLRLIDGVQRVALADSTKDAGSTDSGGGGGGGGSGAGGDCRHGHASFPQFDLVIFFAPLPAVPTASQGTGATAVAGTTAGSAQPAVAQSPAAPAPGTTTPPPSGPPSNGTNDR